MLIYKLTCTLNPRVLEKAQPSIVQVLSPLLLDEELHYIFGRVSTLFSKSLADAYARLEPLVCFSGMTCIAHAHVLIYS